MVQLDTISLIIAIVAVILALIAILVIFLGGSSTKEGPRGPIGPVGPSGGQGSYGYSVVQSLSTSGNINFNSGTLYLVRTAGLSLNLGTVGTSLAVGATVSIMYLPGSGTVTVRTPYLDYINNTSAAANVVSSYQLGPRTLTTFTATDKQTLLVTNVNLGYPVS